MSNFSDKLLEFRKHKKLTMVELAKQSGLSQSYISQLENDHKVPTTEAVNTLSKGLAVKNEILDLQEQEKIKKELLDARNQDDLNEAYNTIGYLKSMNDNFNDEDDLKFKQIYLEDLNKAVDARFIELSQLFDSESKQHFTLYGEPLSDNEKWLLTSTLLGIKEARNKN